MRSVRDIAAMHQALLAALDLRGYSLLGLGFGGWIAAEMATMAPRDAQRLVLAGAMGIKPPSGFILDQTLLSYIAYVKAGLHDKSAFERIWGAEPPLDVLEQWDIHREMCFRVAWKPYMYSQTLPHLLKSVAIPSLVVCGDDDGIVPSSAGEVYAKALPDARLEVLKDCGHFAEYEKPAELARLVTAFAAA
jgi:pimeloyl-ACP methyl ester carboxylesterase